MTGNANSNSRLLKSGPGRRDVQLVQDSVSRTDHEAGKILVRNALTMIYPGVDVALVNRSESEAQWLSLGRLAIGQVQQAGDTKEDEASSQPKGGDWIFWAGPHADFGLLDPARDVWAPVSKVDPLLLPAGIGAEAESGLRPAVESLNRAPVYAVVVGQGMLGHLAAQWLKGQGCSVTVVENSPKRLEFSKYSGLRQKADTHNVDWKKRVEGWNRDGIDLLVDACGNPLPIIELAPSLRSGGAICRLGRWRPPQLPPEVSTILQGVGGRDFGPSPSFGESPAHCALLRDWIGRIEDATIPTERLITHHVKPEEAPLALKRLATGVKSWLGVVIHWEESQDR